MDSRGRAVRVTAIHQDTINGIDDQMPWPVETWAESADDDTLWTACTARDAGSDELGLWYERGDIIIHSHRISGEGMELSGSRTVIHERGADPMRETLDAIAVWNGRPHRVGRSGRVLSPGVERLAVPGDDEPLRMGWHEALATAGGALRRMDPAAVRAATLQRRLDLTRKPCVFFLDAEGDDLVIVRWHARPDGLVDACSFSHLRYDDETMQAAAVAQSERPRTFAPTRMTDGDMLIRGRAIYDEYLDASHPEGLGHVRRSGILMTDDGRRPLLRIGDGGSAPTWDELMDSAAVRLASPSGPTPAETRPGAAEGKRRRERDRAWPSFAVPARAAKPYEFHAKDGRDWDRLVVTLPAGTVVDGRDLGGWSIDRFTSDANRRQIAEGSPVEIRLRPGTPVELFRGRGEARESFAIENPARLAEAVAQSPGVRAARAGGPEERKGQRPHRGTRP